MIPTSINGTDITGATIDGTDVQEITVDGQTVFSAAETNLIARYAFDNNLNDSVGSNDASVTTGSQSFSTDAKVGSHARDYNATGFDQINSVVDGESAFSITAHIKPRNNTNFQIIMRKNPTGPFPDGGDYGFNLSDSGEIRAFGNNDLVGPTLSANTFVHIALTFDSGAIELFVDGTLEDSGTNPSEIPSSGPTSTTNFQIGGPDAGGFDYYDGLIDDVRFYNKALSSAEVTNLINNDSIV